MKQITKSLYQTKIFQKKDHKTLTYWQNENKQTDLLKTIITPMQSSKSALESLQHERGNPHQTTIPPFVIQQSTKTPH